jgi:hypothetical protein
MREVEVGDDGDVDPWMDDVIVVDGLGSGSWRYAGFPVAVQPAAHQADDLAGSSAWASMSMPETVNW